jgi:hypothetical protein
MTRFLPSSLPQEALAPAASTSSDTHAKDNFHLGIS